MNARDRSKTAALERHNQLVAFDATNAEIPTLIQQLHKAEADFESLVKSRKQLGIVYGTGGSRVDSASRMPMDWGVVKPSEEDEVWNHREELNKVSSPLLILFSYRALT